MKSSYKFNETGGVYVVSNPQYKTPIVKIGRSGRENPQERIDELSRQSGVPVDFKTDSITLTAASKIVENIAHKYFEDERINPKKEFFAINPSTATKVVNAISEYVDDHSFVKADFYDPLSEDHKKEIIESGFIPSDYWATPWSETEFFPSLDNCPKGLDKQKLNSAISKY